MDIYEFFNISLSWTLGNKFQWRLILYPCNYKLYHSLASALTVTVCAIAEDGPSMPHWQQYNTRGPWATSLTWENSSCDYIITLIKGRKKNIIKLTRINWFFIWTDLNPLHPRMLCAKFGWNWLSGSGEEDENVKSLWQRQRRRQRRRTTDKFWSEKRTWAFGSGELKKWGSELV